MSTEEEYVLPERVNDQCGSRDEQATSATAPLTFKGKLTQLQTAILYRASTAHGRASTWWLSGQIESKTTYRGCRQLQAKGLLDRDPHGYWPLWTITDAGREALAKATGAPQ